MAPRITATSIDACSTAASGSSLRTRDTVAPVACSNWPTASCAHGSGSSQLKPSRIVTWLRTDASAASRSASTRSACPQNSRPAAVSSTWREVRSSRVTCRMASSCWIVRVELAA